MAVQSDGKVVTIGDATRTSGTADFGIARFSTNGALDSSFSGDGMTTVSFASGNFDDFHGRAIAIQPDGKIVVAGYTRNSTNSDEDFAIARLNTDGSLDQSFSSDGKTTVAFDLGGSAANNGDEATAIAIQPDGKIVIVGFAETGATSTRFAVARLNADGSKDSAFGPQIFSAGTGTAEIANDVAIQADGKIVIAGSSTINTVTGMQELAVIRLSTAGNLDSSFDTDGRSQFVTGVGVSGANGNSVAIQSDGKIVVGGRAIRSSGNDDFLAVRLKTDGILDGTFQGSGYRVVAFDKGSTENSARRDVANAVAIQGDGKIVLAGYAATSTSSRDFAIARILSDGNNDPDFFDTTGRRTVSFDLGGSNADEARSMAIDFTGRIVVGGYAVTSSSVVQAVARLEHTRAPVLDTSKDSFAVLGVGSRQSTAMLEGKLVSEIVASGGGAGAVSDPDNDQKGIAITYASSSLGKFQYTLKTSSPAESDWIDFSAAGAVSNDAALLLPLTARIRFKTSLTPHHEAGASFLPLESKLSDGFGYRAWDGTVGVAGGRHTVLGYNGSDATPSLAFNNSTSELVNVYFEARLFRAFNSNAQLNVYALEAEFNALMSNPAYQDRSTSGYTGFTVLLSAVPELGTAPMYRMYFGVQFNSDGTETDMGYRYLTSASPEADFLEVQGPADKRPQRAGAYFRELGVNSGTAILGYIYTTQQPGTQQMTQVYRTDDFAKPTRPPGTAEGSTPTSTRMQQQGDHVYTTNTAFETSRPGTWRVEANRGFVRELTPSPTGTGAIAQPVFAELPAPSSTPRLADLTAVPAAIGGSTAGEANSRPTLASLIAALPSISLFPAMGDLDPTELETGELVGVTSQSSTSATELEPLDDLFSDLKTFVETME